MTPLVYLLVITVTGRLPVSRNGLPPDWWVDWTSVLDNVRNEDVEGVVVPFSPLKSEP